MRVETYPGRSAALNGARDSVCVEVLRTTLEHACQATALEAQACVCRSLTDISLAAPAREEIVGALYEARLSCIAYLADLERKRWSGGKKRTALIAVDLLEVTLLDRSRRLP